MMKINKYMIAVKPNQITLSEYVDNLINQGWQPYGYPFLDRNDNSMQAMVMYEVEPLKITPMQDGEKLEPVYVAITEAELKQ